MVTYNLCYIKQQRCKIFVVGSNKISAQGTEYRKNYRQKVSVLRTFRTRFNGFSTNIRQLCCTA